MVAQNSSTRSAQSGPFTRKSKTINVDPANIAANTTLAVAIAFPGCKAGDRATVTPLAALEAGVIAGQALVLADGTVTWTLANCTVAAINPAALNVLVSVGTEH